MKLLSRYKCLFLSLYLLIPMNIAYACDKISDSEILKLREKRMNYHKESEKSDIEFIVSAIYSNDGKSIVGTRQTILNYKKISWWSLMFSGERQGQMNVVDLKLCDIDGNEISSVKIEGNIEVGLDEYEPALKNLRDAASKGSKRSLALPGAGGSSAPAAIPPISNAGPRGGREGGGVGPGAGGLSSGVTFVEVVSPRTSGGTSCPSSPGRIVICEKRLSPEQMR